MSGRKDCCVSLSSECFNRLRKYSRQRKVTMRSVVDALFAGDISVPSGGRWVFLTSNEELLVRQLMAMMPMFPPTLRLDEQTATQLKAKLAPREQLVGKTTED